MKKHKTLLRTTVAVAVIAAASVSNASAQLFSEDFESYAAYADMYTAPGPWVNGSATPSISAPADGLILTNRNLVPAGTGIHAGATRFAHDRSYAYLSEIITAGNPSTPGGTGLLTVYMYRNSISTSAGATRNHTSIGASAGASTVAIGWFNNATAVINGTADVFDSATFQGKNTGAGGNFFFNLNAAGTPRRTVGWHKFDIELLADGSQRYYVDNVLGRTVTNAAFNWDVLACGFGTASSVPGVAGEETAFDGIRVTTNHPSITTQPTNVSAAIGGNTTLSVEATAPAGYPITGYQWYFATNLSDTAVYSTNYKAIDGATSATLNVNNVQTTNQGLYFVIVSNSDSFVGSRAARLVIGPPSIISQSTNVSGLEGGVLQASVTASGAPTLRYQWYFGSSQVAGATTSRLTLNPFTQAAVGSYTCVVTNTYSRATSSPVAVTMITNLYPNAMTPVWTKLPGDYTWLTASGSGTRSLAYNAPSNQLVIASRTGATNIIILNADTGAFLYNLAAPETFVGGTFVVNKVAVAEDGAVYICNLTLNGTTANFKIYRYADTHPASTPTTIYDGDPVAGSAERWGDSFDVRGSGNSTELIAASRNGTNVVVFTTTDSVAWTPNLVACNVQPNDIGSSCVFGVGDTFWAKCNDSTNGLFRIGFNIGTGVGTVLNAYTNVPQAVTCVGINKEGCFLMANEFTTIDAARFYDVSSYAVNPILVDWAFYTPRNTGFGAGNLVIYKDRMWSIEDNNGILAQKFNWPVITYSVSGTDLILNWVGTYTLRSSTDLNGAWSNVPGPVTSGPYNTSMSGNKFFQLKY